MLIRYSEAVPTFPPLPPTPPLIFWINFIQFFGSGMFIPTHGSKFFPSRIRIEKFRYFNPKNWFPNFFLNMTVVSSQIRIPNPDLDFLPIPDPGVKKPSVPASGTLNFYIPGLREKTHFSLRDGSGMVICGSPFTIRTSSMITRGDAAPTRLEQEGRPSRLEGGMRGWDRAAVGGSTEL